MNPETTRTLAELVMVCPYCRVASTHPDDVREQYCSYCHMFLDDIMAPGSVATFAGLWARHLAATGPALAVRVVPGAARDHPRLELADPARPDVPPIVWVLHPLGPPLTRRKLAAALEAMRACLPRGSPA